MSDGGLEEIVSEKGFASLVQVEAEMLFRLASTLRARADQDWSRRHFYQLASEADAVESLLDDYGAGHNKTFARFRELIASARGLALAGFSIAHLAHRLDGYSTALTAGEASALAATIARALRFLQSAAATILDAVGQEAEALGIARPEGSFPEGRWDDSGPRRRLPRNLGQRELASDAHKVAELAARFSQAAAQLGELRLKPLTEEHERERWFQKHCTEERARSLEAVVHNLQSVYDTWIKGTALEEADPRLARMRGHASIALHLLEAVTQLVHFVERHEGDGSERSAARRVATLVPRAQTRAVTLNDLLVPAAMVMERARAVSDALLPSYTHEREVQVELVGDLVMHARPAALIVAVVTRYGTPVVLEVDGKRCNAGSILDMMVTLGSAPDARRFRFRGDERPLRDIELLFAAGLGERGMDALPPGLAYLRGNG